MESSWAEFGWILGPSWEASWIQVGTKIGKIGVPRRCQKIIKILGTRGAAMIRCSGPLTYYNTDNTDSTDRQSKVLYAHPSGRWPDVCICFCICVLAHWCWTGLGPWQPTTRQPDNQQTRKPAKQQANRPAKHYTNEATNQQHNKQQDPK